MASAAQLDQTSLSALNGFAALLALLKMLDLELLPGIELASSSLAVDDVLHCVFRGFMGKIKSTRESPASSELLCDKSLEWFALLPS
ncbi:hypothetical protein OPU71_01590 [Niveibacterium sp. 24ML]|uniref:hypothetical protein n=1 Tax=Niveibacterium sp. 24ML TaxID=2985512 RepID=UPI00226FEC76|nr:hypothetical protein [Niveibacterium sp. 24ML]MCX9154812.1 hypothetical protein [Niveibacterium sp. 24ML]